MSEVFVYVVVVATTFNNYDVKSVHKSRETANASAMIMARELVDQIMEGGEGGYEGIEGILIDMYKREGNPLHDKITEIVAANWSDRKEIVGRVITHDDIDTMAKAMIELNYVSIHCRMTPRHMWRK
jgi:hypothetical protein